MVLETLHSVEDDVRSMVRQVRIGGFQEILRPEEKKEAATHLDQGVYIFLNITVRISGQPDIQVIDIPLYLNGNLQIFHFTHARGLSVFK